MHLYEHEAKTLLRSRQLPVPDGYVLSSEADIQNISKGGVLKVQIHAGGRGKAGGVIVSADPATLTKRGLELFGCPIVTDQTDPEGEMVQALYLEDASSVKQEFYASFVMNRTEEAVELLAAKAGGVHIEENFGTDGFRRVLKHGWQSFYARQLGVLWGLPTALWGELDRVMYGLYQILVEYDAVLLEINPFVLTTDDKLMLLDAKMTLDDNALFRHKEYKPLHTSAVEEKAHAFDLNYVQLDGNIGCMVNGAGLAMATMDLIAFHGGKPSNFLDVGGGATVARIQAAGEILLSDKNVKAILVNIVGGIVRCDVLAEGLINALQQNKEQGRTAPTVVVRLQGTREAEGKALMQASGLPFVVEDDLTQATLKAVQAV